MNCLYATCRGKFSAVGCTLKNLNSFEEHRMSAPSRRPEIRRRRTRKEKISQLRKRLTAAKTDADRTRLTAKLHKLGILSPGQPLLK
jgi:uncharacterized protein DUF6800